MRWVARRRSHSQSSPAKDNQEALAEDSRAGLEHAFHTNFAGLDEDEYRTGEKGDGRVEECPYTILHDPEGSAGRRHGRS
jgi:hypothetical protein